MKGRGAQNKTHNRFESLLYEMRDDFLEYCRLEGEPADANKTQYQTIFPKSIVNRVTSPDVGMEFSLNPYQGCEHGCVYCYARNTHEYWGYGAGLDFERVILVKKNAPELLAKKLQSRHWKPKTIVLSGNTDCYQPAEQKFGLTRACLEVFAKYRHPVAIITKNALVLRDLDLLQELAQRNLVRVIISVTSLNETTRRILEPRTVSSQKRLKTLQTLSEHHIPTCTMLAPIIPGINSHEIMDLAQATAAHGAQGCGFTLVRLNGAIGSIFTDWLHTRLPDKAEKVLSLIKQCRGGKLNASAFGDRMKGHGPMAAQIHRMMALAKTKYFQDKKLPDLETGHYLRNPGNQLSFFD
jgi:DNA repair photolyase